MSMQEKWQNKYKELMDFCKERGEIQIQEDGICIPNSIRPQFYFLFDDGRGAFLQENVPDLLELAYPLSRNYVEIEENIVKSLDLKDVSMNRV